MLLNKIIFICYFSFLVQAFSSEVDSFNIDIKNLSDSTEVLNNEIRKIIRTSITELNSQHSFCNKDKLYQILKENLGREVISNVEEFAVKSPLVSKVFRKKEESIFSDLTLTDSVFLTIYPMTMGVTLNINNHLVGSDKIGHFFSEGHYYLFNYIKKNKSLVDAMIFGKDIYEGFMGIEGTGISSSGDLVANFHGYRFWATLIGEQEDPLKLITEPMIKCKDKKWVINHDFDWKDYVDSGWDETKNCSQYKSTIPYDKLGAKLSSEQKNRCFNSQNSQKLKQKYGIHFKYLINTDGFSAYKVTSKKTTWKKTQESLEWGSNVLDWVSIKNILVNF